MDKKDQLLGLLACAQGGHHLLNALRYLGIDPEQIRTQEEALAAKWPMPWAYDVWCAWHACEIALRTAEWPEDITHDRRTGWRTSGPCSPLRRAG